MLNLIWYVGIRHLRAKPTRNILTMAGVAFGIALFIAIDLINRSTLVSFKENIDAVAGSARLTVTAGEPGFPEEKLDVVAKVSGVLHAVPMVESRAYFAGTNDENETLLVFGVDLLKEQSVRVYQTADSQIIDDPLVFLNQPDSLIVTRAFARLHGLKADDRINLATAHGMNTFVVRGMLSPEGPAKAYGGALAIMDIDGARLVFGKEGKLDRIDVVPREGVDIDGLRKDISAALGTGYSVELPDTQNENMQRLVRSFQVMLAFYSTLALLVALFLIANTVNIAVAERRREIGTLRAVGATRTGILTLFLGEAVLVGAAGGFFGAWLGRGLASIMVGPVTRAMSSQYVTRIEVTHFTFGPADVGWAVLLGMVAALFASLWPAVKATTIQPVEAMRLHEASEATTSKRTLGIVPSVGLVLLGIMAVSVSLNLQARFEFMDSVNQACAMLGSALIGPTFVVGLIRLFRPIVLRSEETIARLSQDNLLRNPRRTGSNVMTLMVGLVLTVLIATVNSSLHVTILDWFDRTLQSDLFVSSSGKLVSYQTQPLDDKLTAEIAAVPGVYLRDGLGIVSLRMVRVQYEGRELALKAYDEPEASAHYKNFQMLDRPAQDAGRDVFHSAEPTVLVSQTFFVHFNKKTGDLVTLDTPSGQTQFRIAGMVTDFTNPVGVLFMDRVLYKKYWHDSLVNAFGLRVEPGVELEKVRKEIDRRFGRSKNLTIVSNAELKKELSAVVDQSFAYTRAIEVASLLVGLLGLLSTFLVSVMERTRELGLLRAVGMSRSQLLRMILQEALVQGGLGAVAAVILGSGISYLWITRSFVHVVGFVVEFHFPWVSVAITLVVGTAVALLAGLYPAVRASKIKIRDALGYE